MAVQWDYLKFHDIIGGVYWQDYIHFQRMFIKIVVRAVTIAGLFYIFRGCDDRLSRILLPVSYSFEGLNYFLKHARWFNVLIVLFVFFNF